MAYVLEKTGPEALIWEHAYRPLLHTITYNDSPDGYPAIAWCDVYFNNKYYKTLSATSWDNVGGGGRRFTFDIQSLAQEYIKSFLPDLETYYPRVGYAGWLTTGLGAAHTLVRFRYGIPDVYGIISTTGTAPIQATIDTPAVPGDGEESDPYYILNAAMQHYTDAMLLEQQLYQYKIKHMPVIGVIYDVPRVYSLSYMKKGKVFASDWGFFPVLTMNNPFPSGPTVTGVLKVFFIMKPGSPLPFLVVPIDMAGTGYTLQENSIYLFPSGIANFLISNPALLGILKYIDYYQIAYIADYYPPDDHNYIWCSPCIYLQSPIAQVPPHSRIWYINYLGHLDQLNFVEREATLKTTSERAETPLTRRPQQYDRYIRGSFRQDVRSNETWTITGIFEEDDLLMVKQLAATSNAYLELPGPDNVPFLVGGGDIADQGVQLMPITLLDTEFATLTYEDRYEYRVTLRYEMSNELISVRGALKRTI